MGKIKKSSLSLMLNSNFKAKVLRIFFDSVMFGYLFCVFLVFILAPDEKQLMQLENNFLIFLLSVFLGGIFSSLMNRFGQKTLGEVLFREIRDEESHDISLFKNFWGWQLILFAVVTFVAGLIITKVSFGKLFDVESFFPTMRLFSHLLQPNWSILPRAVVMMVETVFLAFTATVMAIPIAFVACFLSAKNIMKGPAAFAIYLFLRTLLNVTRSIEAFVWAIIFTVWVGIGPFAGMLALMIHSVASLMKQYSEIVEGVDEGPIEAIQSTGANFVQVIWYAIVPQVILPFISFTIYRCDINIRMATIVGFVGGGGIGYLLQTYSSQAMWAEVGTIIVVIAIVVWLMDTASAYIREALK